MVILEFNWNKLHDIQLPLLNVYTTQNKYHTSSKSDLLTK